MIEAGEKYVHGTAAEKLEYNVYEENKVLKAKKRQRQNAKAKVKITLNVLFVFALCFTLIFRYAMITELNYGIDKLNKQYDEIKDENSRLKFDIEKELNLAKIEEIAETRLGMHKPDKNQIIKVDVPKSDFSVAAATNDNSSNDKGVFAAFLNKIGGLANILY